MSDRNAYITDTTSPRSFSVNSKDSHIKMERFASSLNELSADIEYAAACARSAAKDANNEAEDQLNYVSDTVSQIRICIIL